MRQGKISVLQRVSVRTGIFLPDPDLTVTESPGRLVFSGFFGGLKKD